MFNIGTLSVYLDYVGIIHMIKHPHFNPFNCGFMLDVSTPRLTLLHVEMTHAEAFAVILAAVLVKRLINALTSR